MIPQCGNQAESLLSDEEFNTLQFTVVSDLSGIVDWGGMQLFRMSSGKMTQVVRIGDSSDRTMCRCPAGWAF